MGLEQFLRAFDRREVDLLVVNRKAPRPMQSMLERLFDDQPIEVDERQYPDEETDVVYLVEDGQVVATSPLAALQRSILLVNSDLYVTGTRSPGDLELPDVVESLDELRFRLRGYPEAHKEKLLLVTISRYVERVVLSAGDGTLRTSFQQLSRIDDEKGTRRVYERLANSSVDAHVYGIPDWTPPQELDLAVHGGWSEEYRDSWFVVYTPETDEDRHAALLAIETDPDTWDAVWTFDADFVTDLDRYIRQKL
jgi:hypothetical protein